MAAAKDKGPSARFKVLISVFLEKPMVSDHKMESHRKGIRNEGECSVFGLSRQERHNNKVIDDEGRELH